MRKPYLGPANLRSPAWQRLHTRLTVLLVVCSRRLTIFHGFKYMELAMKCLTTACYITLRHGIMLTNLINSSSTCASGFYADDAEASSFLDLSVTDKRFLLARRKLSFLETGLWYFIVHNFSNPLQIGIAPQISHIDLIVVVRRRICQEGLFE